MLAAPQSRRDFNKEWARQILLGHKARTDPGWLLGDMLKVLDVTVTENHEQTGMLSHSYFVQVSYKEDSKGSLRVDSWFVKVPKSPVTAPMDAVEAFVYSQLIPNVQEFRTKALKGKTGHDLPVPKVLYAHHDPDFNHHRNMVVMEDLRDRRFQPLKSDICGVVYMRAQMQALAKMHAAAFAYQEHLGGKRAFLRKNPLIKERLLPKLKIIKSALEERLLAYLSYLCETQKDLQHQMKIFIKFERHLFNVFRTIHKKTEGLHDFKIMVHGDSKLDNFLFKKMPKLGRDADEEYDAILIDWQGACYDFLSTDVMWALYGFMKNLPDKNSTIDSFLDYSLAFYHQELLKELKLLGLTPKEIDLPDNEYDGVQLLKKGFVYDFLRVVLIRPVLSLPEADLLIQWFKKSSSPENDDPNPLPDVKSVFRSGQSYVNFIHLYFTMATEIGVFHELAPMCFSALKEAMFGSSTDGSVDLSEDEDEANANYGLGKDFDGGVGLRDLAKTPEPEARQNGNYAQLNGHNTNGNVNGNSHCHSDESTAEGEEVRTRPSFLRRQSTVTLPEVLEDSDDDYDYGDSNKSVISKTVIIRTPSMDYA